MDSLVEGLTDDEGRGRKASELRRKLQPHIGQDPICQLPRNHLATTGAYTAQGAKQWIAEYEEAMSETPDAGAS